MKSLRNTLIALPAAGIVAALVFMVAAEFANQKADRAVQPAFMTKHVPALIGEISHATGEQTQGVAQVGDSVTMLDKTTQQNAALVEQSAAAAENLSQRAAELMAVVRRFKLPAHA